ncbi:MAG: hypothetical protein AAB423_02820 [Patescibacteria group bacterium]
MDEIARYFENLGLEPSHTQMAPIKGGHMSYSKSVYINDSEKIFVKKFVARADLTKLQSAHALAYLHKENKIINQLSGLDISPEFSELISSNSLILPAYTEESGWFWEAPEDTELLENYISSILSVLSEKESATVDFENVDILPSQQTLESSGWQKLTKLPDLKSQITDKVAQFKSALHPITVNSGHDLVENIGDLINQYRPVSSKELTAFSHHDARQHNIAWHPDLGVRIVDWSWAGMGLPNSDTTMFLVDLTKSGIDVSEYLDRYFNPDHAHILIGFWLARALEPPSKSNPEVRLHQLASAITAYNLIKYKNPT